MQGFGTYDVGEHSKSVSRQKGHQIHASLPVSERFHEYLDLVKLQGENMQKWGVFIREA